MTFGQMRRGVYWPEAHNAVVREVLEKARGGTQVIYCPGNHDELLRAHLGADFGNVLIRDEVIHETADGQRFLVLHGDLFDGVVQAGPWLARLGAHAYDHLLALNGLVSRVRRLLGLRYWSLAGYLKHKVKNAVNYIGDFERVVAAEARRRGVDGMICGHIHHAEVRGNCRARSTATAGTGWRTAPPWWSITTADWSCCAGRTPSPNASPAPSTDSPWPARGELDC